MQAISHKLPQQFLIRFHLVGEAMFQQRQFVIQPVEFTELICPQKAEMIAALRAQRCAQVFLLMLEAFVNRQGSKGFRLDESRRGECVRNRGSGLAHNVAEASLMWETLQ